MSYEPPLRISIPLPSKFRLTYGPNSTGKRGGNLRVRCTNNEYDALKIEAEALGITLATFCRWCAVHVGQELKKHREASSTEMFAGEDQTDGRSSND